MAHLAWGSGGDWVDLRHSIRSSIKRLVRRAAALHSRSAPACVSRRNSNSCSSLMFPRGVRLNVRTHCGPRKLIVHMLETLEGDVKQLYPHFHSSVSPIHVQLLSAEVARSWCLLGRRASLSLPAMNEYSTAKLDASRLPADQVTCGPDARS